MTFCFTCKSGVHFYVRGDPAANTYGRKHNRNFYVELASMEIGGNISNEEKIGWDLHDFHALRLEGVKRVTPRGHHWPGTTRRTYERPDN